MDSRDLGVFVKMLLETDEIERRRAEFSITEEAWFRSRALRDLLLMPLLQIGELSVHFKDASHLRLFPGVPWRDIKGFRNVVVHGYGHVDPAVAWNSATSGVSELRAALLANDEVRRAYEEEAALQPADGPVDVLGLISSLPPHGEE